MDGLTLTRSALNGGDQRGMDATAAANKLCDRLVCAGVVAPSQATKERVAIGPVGLPERSRASTVGIRASRRSRRSAGRSRRRHARRPKSGRGRRDHQIVKGMPRAVEGGLHPVRKPFTRSQPASTSGSGLPSDHVLLEAQPRSGPPASLRAAPAPARARCDGARFSAEEDPVHRVSVPGGGSGAALRPRGVPSELTGDRLARVVKDLARSPVG